MELIDLAIKKYDATCELLASQANHLLSAYPENFDSWPNWRKVCFNIFNETRIIIKKFPQVAYLTEEERETLKNQDRNLFELMCKLEERSVPFENFENVYFRMGQLFEKFTIKRDAFSGFLTDIAKYCETS